MGFLGKFIGYKTRFYMKQKAKREEPSLSISL